MIAKLLLVFVVANILCECCVDRRDIYHQDLAEMADNISVDEVNDLLTCSLCSNIITEPRSLPCLHNFCKVCLGECLCFKN